MKFLVLHGYSADNAGDGLLVQETIELLKEVRKDAEIDLLALYPESFKGLDAKIIDGSPRTIRGVMEQLRSGRRMDDYDLVLGVGGGYLRSGSLVEGTKTALAHGMQLFFAGRTNTPVAYLPQSVGPLRFGTRRPVTRLFKNIDRIYLRDDRSMQELSSATPTRTPDLALLSRKYSLHSEDTPSPVPVLSVRNVRGAIPAPVVQTARRLSEFDGYVQSRGAGNDDVSAMHSLGPRTSLSKEDLLSTTGPRRVVIAMRLHAALMALNAGHWVIHLAYERKGFGAFQDLGLSPYVHNVNDFCPNTVISQATALLSEAKVRTQYAQDVERARHALETERALLVQDLQQLLASTDRKSTRLNSSHWE